LIGYGGGIADRLPVKGNGTVPSMEALLKRANQTSKAKKLRRQQEKSKKVMKMPDEEFKVDLYERHTADVERQKRAQKRARLHKGEEGNE
jgi:hypothetical protein